MKNKRQPKSKAIIKPETEWSSDPADAEWVLPASTLLGSSVRAAGIEREIQARLRPAYKDRVAVEGGRVVLRMPDANPDEVARVSQMIAAMLGDIDVLAMNPGEIEDILGISSRERLKWSKDARLKNTGTKTIKLRGRAKAVTFFVFDPRYIEDVLDRDLPALWREEDIHAGRENRKRAAAKAASRRAGRDADGASSRTRGESGGGPTGVPRTKMKGWKEFDAEGLLR